MNLPDFELWGAKLAGVAGAVISLRYVEGTRWEKATMAASGSVVAYYFGPYISERLETPETIIGFLLGLFGMAVSKRIWEAIQMAPIAEFWKAAVDRVRGNKGA